MAFMYLKRVSELSMQPEQPPVVSETPLLQVAAFPVFPEDTVQFMTWLDCDNWPFEGTQLSAMRLTLQRVELMLGTAKPSRTTREAGSIISMSFPKA